MIGTQINCELTYGIFFLAEKTCDIYNQHFYAYRKFRTKLAGGVHTLIKRILHGLSPASV